jgi:hypothetical protein
VGEREDFPKIFSTSRTSTSTGDVRKHANALDTADDLDHQSEMKFNMYFSVIGSRFCQQHNG